MSQLASNHLPQTLTRRDSNITGVMASLPSTRHLNQEQCHGSNFQRPASLEHYLNQLAIWPDAIPPPVEEHLINVYFENANRRWPFLLKETFCTWHSIWRRRSHERHHVDLWQGFFVNMVI